MIVRAQKIRFTPDRKPMPKKIKLGFEGDNMVERLAFDLPVIADSQTATLMMGGAYANAVQLAMDGEEWYADLTAEIVGAEGEIEAYVRIDGAGGEVWQSDVMTLITGDVPDVETEIEQRFPTAVETMLRGMAEHSAEMEQQAIRAEEAAELSGGYYTPEVDGGILTWTASKPAMPALPSADIRGPRGEDGERGADGDPGVYMGADEPTDPDVKVWIDPTGQADVPSEGGGSGGIIRETDPTVPDWAKKPQKPTYTAEEVGALPKDTPIPEVYTLPTASETVKGGVKIGKGLVMDGEMLGVTPEDEYELIDAVSIGTTNILLLNAEPDGTPYSFKGVYVEITTPQASKAIPGVITFNGSPAGYYSNMYTTHSVGQLTKGLAEIRNGMLRCYSVSVRPNGSTGTIGDRYEGSISDKFENIASIRVALINGDTEIPDGATVIIKGVRV